jgi:hypothetical protein
MATTTQQHNGESIMKIHKLVNVLGALNDTGKLACDMYELGKKRYYSKAHQQEIPISEMDFQHMVRAFVKQNDEDVRTDTQEGKVRELQERCNAKDDIIKSLHEKLKAKPKEKDQAKFYDDIIENNDKIYKKNLQEQENKILELTTRIHNLQGMLKERDELLEQSENIAHKETESKEYWRNLYHDSMQFGGARYVFAEIPNNDYGRKLTRGMKVFLNNDSYTMRVRGQHIKPELKGTGATHYGQNIEQSTHLRVYIDKK